MGDYDRGGWGNQGGFNQGGFNQGGGFNDRGGDRGDSYGGAWGGGPSPAGDALVRCHRVARGGRRRPLRRRACFCTQVPARGGRDKRSG